jgi:hypothetical protein
LKKGQQATQNEADSRRSAKTSRKPIVDVRKRQETTLETEKMAGAMPLSGRGDGFKVAASRLGCQGSPGLISFLASRFGTEHGRLPGK